MKIAIWHSGPRFGGIENQILLLIKELKRHHQIVFITNFPQAQLAMELQNAGVQVYCNYDRGVAAIIRTAKICKDNKVEILQTHTFSSSFPSRLVKLVNPKIKIVVRVHTYIRCSWIPTYKKKLYYLLDSLLSPLVAAYLINGNYLVQEFVDETRIKRNKLYSIFDGIDGYSSEPPVTFDSSDLKELRMLMIANIIPHKGHDTLIEAFKILRSKGVMAHCDILGDAGRDQEYANCIKNRIEEADLGMQIHLLGFSRDVKNVIRQYKIVILPSDSEGTPNCIMEGMSAGRLCVVSNTGGVPEMIDTGSTGLLHKPVDPVDLATTLEKVAAMQPSILSNMAKKGQEFWHKTMSASAMACKVEQIYRKL